MRRHRESSHSALVIITTLMTVFLVPLTSDGARSSRQRNNQASYRQQYGHRDNDVSQPDNDYYYDDEGSCDIEVACRTETDEAMPPTSMKLPIRGPKGPPGEPGRPGQDGIPGLPGLPGESFNPAIIKLPLANVAALRDASVCSFVCSFVCRLKSFAPWQHLAVNGDLSRRNVRTLSCYYDRVSRGLHYGLHFHVCMSVPCVLLIRDQKVLESQKLIEKWDM